MEQSSQTERKFEKTSACPTNEKLLEYLQAGQLESGSDEIGRVIEHLKSCEFCELSLELLRAHPNVLPLPSIPPVPEKLRTLWRRST